MQIFTILQFSYSFCTSPIYFRNPKDGLVIATYHCTQIFAFAGLIKKNVVASERCKTGSKNPLLSNDSNSQIDRLHCFSCNNKYTGLSMSNEAHEKFDKSVKFCISQRGRFVFSTSLRGFIDCTVAKSPASRFIRFALIFREKYKFFFFRQNERRIFIFPEIFRTPGRYVYLFFRYLCPTQANYRSA